MTLNLKVGAQVQQVTEDLYYYFFYPPLDDYAFFTMVIDFDLNVNGH